MADTLKSLVEAYLLHIVTQECESGARVMIGPVDDSKLVPRGVLSSSLIHGICRRALGELDRVVACAGAFDYSVEVKPRGHVLLTVTRKGRT